MEVFFTSRIHFFGGHVDALAAIVVEDDDMARLGGLYGPSHICGLVLRLYVSLVVVTVRDLQANALLPMVLQLTPVGRTQRHFLALLGLHIRGPVHGATRYRGPAVDQDLHILFGVHVGDNVVR